VTDRKKRRQRLSQQDLQAAGTTPGLMVRRIGPEGRSRLQQLSPEGPERRQQFARRLIQGTKDTPASEEAS
jgi:hypothetical protein